MVTKGLGDRFDRRPADDPIRKDRTRVNASLVLVKSDGTLKDVPLRPGTNLVGRESEAQIRIPASGVSRRHCSFEVRNGDVILRDLKSRNGTYVNGERIEERALKAGDAIAIDEFVFVFRLNGAPAAIDPGVRARALPKDAEDSFFGPSPAAPGPARSSGGSTTSPQTKAAPGAKGKDPGDSSVGGFDLGDLLDDEKDMPKL